MEEVVSGRQADEAGGGEAGVHGELEEEVVVAEVVLVVVVVVVG